MHTIRTNIAISDSGFIFNPSTGDSYSVNPLGQEIISLIRGGKSEESIFEHILGNYHVERPAAEKDLADYLNMLKNYKIAE